MKDTTPCLESSPPISFRPLGIQSRLLSIYKAPTETAAAMSLCGQKLVAGGVSRHPFHLPPKQTRSGVHSFSSVSVAQAPSDLWLCWSCGSKVIVPGPAIPWGGGGREGENNQEVGCGPAHVHGPSRIMWPCLAAKEAGKYCVWLGGHVPSQLFSYDRGRGERSGRRAEILLRKGWFAPLLRNLSESRCPLLKWAGGCGECTAMVNSERAP